VPLEAFEELQAVIAQKNEEIHTAEAQRDSWRRKARGVRLGKKAVQSVRRSS